MMRLTHIATAIGIATAALTFSAPAHADAHCQTVQWGFLGSQLRRLCDGPLHADGSWMRERTIWTPAHQVPISCYYTCYGGYYVGNTVTDDETYLVTPETVLADEPGHL